MHSARRLYGTSVLFVRQTRSAAPRGMAAAAPAAPPLTVHLVRGEHFTLPTRYRDLRHLGAGAYGSVCAAVDAVTGRCVVCVIVRACGWPDVCCVVGTPRRTDEESRDV